LPPDPAIAELLETLSERMPLARAAGWDPVGLQLGDPAAPVARLAVCHEVTESVVAALERAPVELLICYHPLLFRPTRELVAGRGAGGRAWRLARAGVGLAVLHTAFDAAPGGAADALAEALGLEEPQRFGPLEGAASLKIATFVPAEAADALLEAVVSAGAARIGNYTHCSFRSEGVCTFLAGAGTRPVVGEAGQLNREPETRLEFAAPRSALEAVLAALVAAHPYEEPAYDVYERRGEEGFVGRVGRAPAGTTLGTLAERVASALRVRAPRIAGDRARPVERIAVVPGSGGDLALQARQRGAQVLVTGDLSHHPAREALDLGLSLIDPGHAASERPGLLRLLEWVEALGLETQSLLEHDPDPWQA
jgi:dinuclear metal center YbgI/SA1388 family protein